eukprot:378300_1
MNVLFILSVLVQLIVNIDRVYAHRTNAYCHGSSCVDGNRYNWMRAALLDDETLLSEISIPGTHDTMSFYGGDYYQTQTMDLMTQLNSGIRFLDIRADCDEMEPDKLAIYHGQVPLSNYQYAHLRQDVFAVIKQFLDAHIGQTIIMRLKLDEAGG